jgi:hypothetical protein
MDDKMLEHTSVTEIVAAILAVVSVGAIVYLAVEGQPNAGTALTGLVGAASSYFLTPRLNGNGKQKDPPVTQA